MTDKALPVWWTERRKRNVF